MQTNQVHRALSNCPWHTSRLRQVKCNDVISPGQAAQNPLFIWPQRSLSPSVVSVWTPRSHHCTEQHTTGLERSRSLGKQEHSFRKYLAKVSMPQDMNLLDVGPRDNLHSKKVFMMSFTFKDPGPPVASQISKVPFFFTSVTYVGQDAYHNLSRKFYLPRRDQKQNSC